MPPAALAAPSALGWAGIGLGGASLLDQLFGSGADQRDMQQQGLDMQRMLGEAQLPDIQRRTALNAELQKTLMDMFKNPQLPGQFLDLDPVMQQFIPGMDLLDNSLFESVGPGVMSKSALDQLMGLGGNVGTGGVQGFANSAIGVNRGNEQQFQNTIGQLVQSLLQSGAFTKSPSGAPATPGLPWTAGPGGAFNFPGIGG